jgi:hypothetical protein
MKSKWDSSGQRRRRRIVGLGRVCRRAPLPGAQVITAVTLTRMMIALWYQRLRPKTLPI